jgi:hypothetical protein
MCSSLVMAAQAKNRCFQVVRRGRSKLVNEAPLADSFWSDIAIVREMLTTTWSPTVNSFRDLRVPRLYRFDTSIRAFDCHRSVALCR